MKRAYRKNLVEFQEDVDPQSIDIERINRIRELQAVRVLIAEAEFISAKNSTLTLRVQFQQLKKQLLDDTASIEESRHQQRSTLLTNESSIRSINRWSSGEIAFNHQLDTARSNLESFRQELATSELALEATKKNKLLTDKRLIKLNELIQLLKSD